ncbi:hypothetical protein ACN95_00125 [Gordonia sihwensis]|nr:hypothetical protein CXX93_03285 [Gordonia sp. YC-JH1]KJR05590.1 hypothetical protein UG54_16020 [Gordonia sihwensis]KXT56933.1 hypothetical protein Y710_10600 [Gordonia sp. QH-12]MBY4568431.1 hypothetical protein [Gordonia sihwensis]
MQAVSTLQQLERLIRSQHGEVRNLSSEVRRVAGSTSTKADDRMVNALQASSVSLDALQQRIAAAMRQAEDIARRL